MSEKMQRNAATLQQQMYNRYGDEHSHKHCKSHLRYQRNPLNLSQDSEQDEESLINCPSGKRKEFNSRKTRKRLDIDKSIDTLDLIPSRFATSWKRSRISWPENYQAIPLCGI